jgi:predicted acylesterase/phospholipase RssA
MGEVEHDPLAEEVRVAMALNGGVSLAVWMGGCAAELDCARRAHLAPEPGRRAYHALCRAFRRELVVDLMSGSSAGGINGALLGAAISHRRRLNPDFLREQWLELGEFESLLYKTSEAAPGALMQGRRFHDSLRGAFEAIIEGDERNALPPGQEALAELDVQLDVTTTDVIGERRAFMDQWERELVAREYRARFGFRQPEDYNADALAVAARSSASFPFAFEPWRVDDGALAKLRGSRWVVDGGLLDNAPIGAALELIPGRPAARQVRRYVCYMNAEPPEEEEPVFSEARPKLQTIGGYVVGLPRKAPFVDQLEAVERATRQSVLSSSGPASDLLTLDLAVLEGTALQLLPTYTDHRRLLSLEELFGEPAKARAAYKKDVELPWIPVGLAPRRGDVWQWGIRPAERVMYLLLDAIRDAATGARAEERVRLFAAKAAVYARLDDLRSVEPARSDEDVDRVLERAIGRAGTFDPLPELRRAAAAVHDVRELLAPAVVEALFGDEVGAELSDAAFALFLRRALAIEVVRRALAPDDDPAGSGQELRFAQITPYAPGAVFADAQKGKRGWSTPAEKLTGLGLGHFAGFYRGSWRVNDYMWGRLDAAARINDLMVAPGRATQIVDDGERHPGAVLAEELLQCEPRAEQRWLIEEVIGEHGDDLEAVLGELLVSDLAGRGELTRYICTRAAQLEILAQELPVLDRESKKDAGLGAGAPALDLPEGLRAQVEQLREGDALTKRLNAPDEVGSALALRTGAHAALVLLSMLRAAKMPGARALFGMRAAILPLAGGVAQSALPRLAAAWGFWAAALFLTARVVSLGPVNPLDVTTLFAELVALLALLVVLGTTLAPIIRARYASSASRRWKQAAVALAIALTGGLGAAVLAWAGPLSFVDVIAAPRAEQPPAWVLDVVVAFFVGGPLVMIPAFVRGRVGALLAKPWAGLASLIAVSAVAALVFGYSVGDVASALDGDWWEAIGAILGLFAAPLVALGAVFGRRAR